MTVLSVPTFGGGVVKEGSADTQRTDELSACDSFDIGPRGQLIATSDLTAFAQALSAVDTPLQPVFGMFAAGHARNPILFFIGSDGTQPVYASLPPDGSLAEGGPVTPVPVAPLAGVIVTFASFPYTTRAGVQVRVILVAIASRSFQYPNSGYGLFVITYDPSVPSYLWLPISEYDALGTGNSGEKPGGTWGLELAPRGVVVYNNHAFVWGLSVRDLGGDGPNRLMFSNIGNPLKWGLDPQEQAILDGDAETNRQFEDSDAIEIGGSGEAIRCCYPWRGKLWIGTNRELHYLEGFGRESFKTNGSLAIAKSRNVIGPYAMIEGPDGLLYGVSDQGLWRFAGAAVETPGDKLRDFDGKSRDYWDLIWTDPSRTLLSYPGRTNQDLVWMLVVGKQVWVVIPHCNAAAGVGYGTDSVIIKYHTTTGGFSRQPFPGRLLTAGSPLEREASASAATFVCDSAADAATNVHRYAYTATPLESAVLPTSVPDVTFGPYAPFGSNGVGVLRHQYLTLSWAGLAALPLALALSLIVDGQPLPAVTVTIGPSVPDSPVSGDVWVDTSGLDANLGNATAGTIVLANPLDYQIRRYVASWSKWVHVSGGGQQGTRVTVPVSFGSVRGTRFSLRVRTVVMTGRFQIEQFGDKPVMIREAV